MGRHTIVGNSPVSERDVNMAVSEYHRTRGTRWEAGGTTPKPKYYLMTDSEKYSDGKLKRTPEGE